MSIEKQNDCLCLRDSLSALADEILVKLVSLSLIRGFHKSYFLSLAGNGVEAKVKLVRWGKVYTIDVVEVSDDIEGEEIMSFQFEVDGVKINIIHREVNVAFRRQGLASLVISIIEGFAKEKLKHAPKIEKLRLEVNTSQASVIQLAEASGFQGETNEAARILALISANSSEIFINPETKCVSWRVTPENVAQSIAIRICLVKDIYK